MGAGDAGRIFPIPGRFGTVLPDRAEGLGVIRRAALVAALTAVAALGGVVAQASAKVPYFKHVFVVVLENENASTTFGPYSQAPYLAQTLKNKGAYVPNYYGIAHNWLGNYMAMVSGLSPNIADAGGLPGLQRHHARHANAAGGQSSGPDASTRRVSRRSANQLGDAGYQWKGYMEDMNANAPQGRTVACRHPAIGAKDPMARRRLASDQYATRHNPFVYFHSMIDFSRRALSTTSTTRTSVTT